MVYVMLHTNRTFTDEFFPFFEIVYVIELRLSMCNLVVQGLVGMTARLVFLYNQYVEAGPLNERPSVIIASILRCSMFEAFCGLFYFISFERLVATFAWSWYEKASLPTLTVFIVIETSAQLWSFMWAVALILEFINSKHLVMGMAASISVGVTTGLFVAAVNYRESVKLRAGAHINGYSVARTYQIRENALIKIGVRVMILNTPVLILGVCHLFLGGQNGLAKRMISRAFFDLVISLYPALIITYLPLSDVIFERSLKRLPYGGRLFSAFSVLHWASRKRKPEKVAVNETDHYFSMLAASLNGPPPR